MSVREQLRSYRILLPMLRKAELREELRWLRRRPQLLAGMVRRRLTKRFSAAAVAELAAAIAWENNRGRFNQALGIRPAGFSEGAACAIPERLAS